MFHFILFFILASLVLIIIQDFRAREVGIFVLVTFFVSSFLFSCFQNGAVLAIKIAWSPLIFIFFQLMILFIVFSVKRKKWENIIDKQLGTADIIFWFGLIFHFSIMNFVLFFILSIIFTLMCSIIMRLKLIPLAGLQALFLIIFLIVNQFIVKFSPYNDLYFINLLF